MENLAHLTRQLDILPPEHLDTPITVVGAGAIGSMLVWGLAKSGFRQMSVYDFDKIDVENMSCSLYRPKDIGRPKVDALAEIVREFADVKIYEFNERFTKNMNPESGIVVAAVDSMTARKLLWEIHKNHDKTLLFIDPRMSAESGSIFALNPCDPAAAADYEATLYKDEDAVQERCTEKSTTYTSMMLPGQVVNTIKSFLTKREPYAKVMHWSIRHNDMFVIKSA